MKKIYRSLKKKMAKKAVLTFYKRYEKEAVFSPFLWHDNLTLTLENEKKPFEH